MYNEEEWNSLLEEKAKKLIDDLGDYVNNFSYENQAKLFVEKLWRQHPTLQANVIRMLLRVLVLYTGATWVDPRNQHAVDSCKQIKKFIEENPQYIPTI